MFADILYACDMPWWDKYLPEVRASGFKGELCSQDERAGGVEGLTRVPGERRPGLGHRLIHFGGNSGYQAINLAYLRGACRVVLLGYDMQLSPSGRSHWHGDHPSGLSKHSPYHDWVRQFNRLAQDLREVDLPVINASRVTALECFQREELEVALGMG